MNFRKNLILKTFFTLISCQFLFNFSKANAAQEIKIIYGIFSRTIEVNSLKMFAEEGGAIVVEESPSLVEDLSEKLSLVLKSPSNTRVMADKALKTGKPNASKNIIKTIEILLGINE